MKAGVSSVINYISSVLVSQEEHKDYERCKRYYVCKKHIRGFKTI